MKSPQYKTKDGDYLVIDERRLEYDRYRLVWYIREWQDYGGIVGDTIPGDVAPNDREEWEVWQAARSVMALAEGRDHYGYYFASKAKARAALAAANAGLLSGEAPWPVWAQLAKAAGWTPPEGWMP